MKKLITLIALLIVASSAFAGTAYWTGEVQYITTISYQQGVRCGYNYNGQHFYMVFNSTICPSSINV